MKAVTRDEKQENHHSTNTISRRDALVTATSAFAAASMLQSSVLTTPARAQQKVGSSEDLIKRATGGRAVDAAIWGMPIVSFDVMRQAFFRDAKATYGDIMFWSKPGGWKLQCLTPNTSVRYVFSFTNTSQAGPVVVEVPATGDAALNGTIMDAWQLPLTDVGIVGEDQGKGGKYLLLPPDHQGDVPSGYIAVPMKTYNGFVGLRVIIKSEDEALVRGALAYLRLIRIYPLSKSAAPPQSNFVDMADTLWDAVARFNDGFYTSMARMVSEEPVQPRDAEMTGMLRMLGIEKGKEFKPDEPMRAVLNSAAQEAQAWFMERLVTYGSQYWPDGKWDVPAAPIGPKSGFTWKADGILDVDARGIAFFSFFCPPKKLGTGQFYLVTFFDSKGQRLRGGETYRLRVPGDVPISQFWSVTVYEHATCALIRNVARPSIDSYDKKASKNADGSIDIYFGPKAPNGMEANWVPTVAGKDWFPYFRFYGPQQPLFTKTWKLPDIEKMS
jgi:hypothetical protein